MDLQILFFTVTNRIIHVTVMSHSRDDNRKEELNPENTTNLTDNTTNLTENTTNLTENTTNLTANTTNLTENKTNLTESE